MDDVPEEVVKEFEEALDSYMEEWEEALREHVRVDDEAVRPVRPEERDS